MKTHRPWLLAVSLLTLGPAGAWCGTLEDEVVQLRLPFAEATAREAPPVRARDGSAKAAPPAALAAPKPAAAATVPAPPSAPTEPRRSWGSKLGGLGFGLDVLGTGLAIAAAVGMSAPLAVAAGLVVAVGSLLIESVRFHQESDALRHHLSKWVGKLRRR